MAPISQPITSVHRKLLICEYCYYYDQIKLVWLFFVVDVPKTVKNCQNRKELLKSLKMGFLTP